MRLNRLFETPTDILQRKVGTQSEIRDSRNSGGGVPDQYLTLNV